MRAITKRGNTITGGASQWLLMIGSRKAAWILLTNGVVDAKTALDWGLVSEVVPYKELDEAVEKLWKVWKSTEHECMLAKKPLSTEYKRQKRSYTSSLSSGILPCSLRNF